MKSVHLDVSAREMWVPTSLRVSAGDQLSFRAQGIWFDAVIPCSADGYAAPLFYALDRPPRIPDGNRYFRLMGRIAANGREPESDDIAATFPIGVAGEHLARSPGLLFVFVNDRAGYYWNNFGSVHLSIDCR